MIIIEPSKLLAIFSKVHNRGTPPANFIVLLVDAISKLPSEIFSEDYGAENEPEIYEYLATNAVDTGFAYGPWVVPFDAAHEPMRRAVMCEVLRVLGGFESSWNWNAGVDTTNPDSDTWPEYEAGMFQCSANSLNFDRSLSQCFSDHYRHFDPDLKLESAPNILAKRFVRLTKASSVFAIEHCARLLRFTIRHHGPIVRREILPYLNRDAVNEFLSLLTNTPSTPPNPMEKIRYTFDAGHGSQDSGAVGYLNGGMFKESNIALGVVSALAKLLVTDGRFDVTLTRNGDTFLSLTERAAIANKNNATMFSIHANSGGGTGYECYTTPGKTNSDDLATTLLASYGHEFSELPGRYDKSDGDPDKEAKFAVLTGSKGKAILFELGFMDRPSDLAIMVDPGYSLRAAKALYQGILAHEKLAPAGAPPDNPPPPPAPVDTAVFDKGRRQGLVELILRFETAAKAAEAAVTPERVASDLMGARFDLEEASMNRKAASAARGYLYLISQGVTTNDEELA